VRPEDIAIKILEAEGLSYWTVHASGLPRSFSPLKAWQAATNAVKGFGNSWQALKKWTPQTIVGMGSHISFPVVMAGKLRGIPVVLHEQNVIPGLTNRILARWAEAVAVSFPESQATFGRKAVLTGNPIRKQFKNIPATAIGRKNFGLDENTPTVLVFGGSLGAHVINEKLLQALRYLKQQAGKIQFLHLAGPRDRMLLEEGYRRHNFRACTLERTDQMAHAYAAADIVVSRSGATTIAELVTVKKRALLIPYPHASENHQTANALVLVKCGLAQLIEESNLDPQNLAAAILKGTQNTHPSPSKHPVSVPDPLEAAEKLADVVDKITLQ